MIRPEALSLLAVADRASPAEIRGAYLRRVVSARLDDDPANFLGLREAYELLIHGTGATAEDLAADRAAVSARPDDVEARWQLLADVPYGGGPEASAILREGAERRPEAFLDELLLHFPDRVAAEPARRARDGAPGGRLLLLADVHATEGRPAEALEALRAALTGTNLIVSPALLRLALRPIFSLQIHAQTGPAREALAAVQGRMSAGALEGEAHDLQTVTMLRVAVELATLDETFPLDLRQVAARAAKRGDFQNAPYEAKYATRLLKPGDVPKLNAQLKRDAPTLAGILGLTITEERLRPRGTQTFLRPYAWGTAIVATLFYIAFTVYRVENRKREDERMFHEIATTFVSGTLNDIKRNIERDCVDPNSDRCRQWRTFFSNDSVQADGGQNRDSYGLVRSALPDAGIRLEDLGIIGKPGTPDNSSGHLRRGQL